MSAAAVSGRSVGGILGVLVVALFLTSCGGEGTVEVMVPGGPDDGPQISGQVQLPNGELAQAPVLWQRLAAIVASRVQALVAGNVKPVGANVEVRLSRVQSSDIRNGVIRADLPVIRTVRTNENGQYETRLRRDTNENVCRYLVWVGSAEDGTLTRAFVFTTDDPVDINFQSEAVVRLILDALRSGTAANLCDFEAGEIEALYQAVLAAPAEVMGDTVAQLNANGTAAAAADANVQAVLAASAPPGPPIFPTPTHTSLPPPSATATPNPTATRTRTPTATTAPTTAAPTLTRTTVPASPTPTQPMVSTSSPTPVLPTHTATVPPTTTVTATSIVPPTATPSVPPPATPQVNIGTVSGAAGTSVSVPVLLVGTAIVAVANDIEFDTGVIDVVMAAGKPDCEAAPGIAGNKRVLASVPSVHDLPPGRKVLRVGVIGVDNNAALPQGPLYTCRFAVADTAPTGTISLLNTPDASDGFGDAVAVGGSDGSVEVTASPPALDLSSATANAGQTLTVDATLQRRGQNFSAVAADITFDSSVVDVVLDDESKPECVADDAIGLSGDLDKEAFAQVLPGEGAMKTLRVGLVARDNNAALPDGLMFSCRFTVAPAAGPQTIVLDNAPDGSAPDGTAASLGGRDAQITVQ